jgi:hypothetical protein
MPDPISSTSSSPSDPWLDEAERARLTSPEVVLPTHASDRAHRAQDLAPELTPLADFARVGASPDWRRIPFDVDAYPSGGVGDELLVRNAASLERARALVDAPADRVAIDARVAKLSGAIDARKWTALQPERDQRSLEQSRMDARLAPLSLASPPGVRVLEHVAALAMPIAHASEDIASMVPVLDHFIAFAQVATGRDLLGLGEPLDDIDRLLSAAVLLAPLGGELFEKGASARRASRGSRRRRAGACRTSRWRFA